MCVCVCVCVCVMFSNYFRVCVFKSCLREDYLESDNLISFLPFSFFLNLVLLILVIENIKLFLKVGQSFDGLIFSCPS